MQGRPLNDFKKEAESAGAGIRDFAAPEGESWKDVNARAKDFIINDIIGKHFRVDGNNEAPTGSYIFLVVTHGGFIMEFTNAFKWIADPAYADKFNNNSRNCSISIFHFQ